MSTDLVQALGSDVVVLPGMTATALTLPPDLTFEEWRATGHALARMGRGLQWWLGDLLNFGEAAFGETYAQVISELGLDYQTVSNYAWVSRTYPVSSREESLSWRAHLDAAGIQNPSDRAEVLLRAATEGWSTRAVRAEANRLKALAKPAKAPEIRTVDERNVTALAECLADLLPDDLAGADPLWLRWAVARGLDAQGVKAPNGRVA